jgi:hypothetical protein
MEVVPVLIWNSNFDSSVQKEKKIFNYDSCFATALTTQAITAPIVPVVIMT